jgi:radical SAM-linked protein
MTGRYLLRFSKRGLLKYTGHLDLLRLFQRTLRRTGLPVAYSQGFNPHILMSFALPLSLGMESERDYCEIILDRPAAEDAIQMLFNAVSPNGLAITGVKPLPDDASGVASLAAAADYLVTLTPHVGPAERISNALREILAERVIVVPKKTKSGVKDTDVRQDIFGLSFMEIDPAQITLRLAAGSSRFLNPKLAVGLILERLDATIAVSNVTRLELYDAAFRSLFGESL